MTERQTEYIASRADVLRCRAVSRTARSNQEHWVVCLIAMRIVGNYEPGETKKLAQDLGVTISRVEDYASAGWGYRQFRRFGVNSEIRKNLYPGHFEKAYLALKKYEPNPQEIAEDLRIAAENRVTIGAFEKALSDNYGDGKPDSDWKLKLRKLVRLMLDLAVDSTAPGWLCKALTTFADTLKAAAKKNERLEL